MYDNGDTNVHKAQVVGILRPKEGKEYSPVQPGVAYMQELTALMREEAEGSEIATAQKEWDYNPLTGAEYDSNSGMSDIMNSLLGGSTIVMTERVVSQMIGVCSTPSLISIYASDFDNKDLVLKDLDAWNDTHENKEQVKYTEIGRAHV